jgi:hypothetical protein
MPMSWLDAWTSYSVTTKKIHNKVSIYRGLVFAAKKAFGLEDVAGIPDAKVLKLRELASLLPAKTHATRVVAAIDALAGAALQLLRERVASNIDLILSSREHDEYEKMALRSLASKVGLRVTKAVILEEALKDSPTQAASDVTKKIKLSQRSLRNAGLLTDHEVSLLRHMDSAIALDRALKQLNKMIEPAGVKPARSNVGAATRHNLQRLAKDVAKCQKPLGQLAAPPLEQARQTVAETSGQLLDAITRIVNNTANFYATQGVGLATAESQLTDAFGEQKGEVPRLAQVLLDAEQHAGEVQYGLSFDELMRMAFAVYATYPKKDLTDELEAVTAHIKRLEPIVHDAKDYCVKAGIDGAAARSLVSRLWLMVQIYRQSITRVTEENDVCAHREAIFAAYLDLFFQKHTQDKKRRNFIEAPLIYWTQGLDFTKGVESAPELLQDIENELDQTSFWPMGTENLPRLKRLIRTTSDLFGWSLRLDPFSERYDEMFLTENIGRACRNEYAVHNEWTNKQPYAFNKVYALIPGAEQVPRYAELKMLNAQVQA